MTCDYETIETHLGDCLRHADNLDIHSDNFFPVTLLDRIFHYSEEKHGTEMEGGRKIHRNFHGHDFDRWIDNLIARTSLSLLGEDGEVKEVELVDIDSLEIGYRDGEVAVVLPDETRGTLLDDAGVPAHAESLEELGVVLDISDMFDMPPVDSDAEQYLGFGTLAQIVRVVCERSGLRLEDGKMSAADLSERIFRHFSDELVALIPSLWNDMEHVAHYARCRVTAI